MSDTTITNENKVAVCVSCLIADALKSCSTCAFNTGLAVRKVHMETLRLADDKPAQERFWETFPAWLWEEYWHYAFQQAYDSGSCRGYPNHMVVLP